MTSKDIPDDLSYTTISHTWGRWRIPGASVTVEKVPWAIPLNTRFDVSALPALFSQQSWSTRYLWFDLFCIPQDGSKLAGIEISRQADIFRNSTKSALWLNDIESWDALSNAVT